MSAPKGNKNALGSKHSEATKARYSAMRKGKPQKGGVKKHSEETKLKIAQSLKGNDFAKGIKWSIESRQRVTKNEDHLKWGGKWRNTPEYWAWRKQVFERDNYTCQDCGERGKRIQADHIKKYADFPELRLDLNNGRTLCEECHKLTPNFMNKKPKELQYA